MRHSPTVCGFRELYASHGALRAFIEETAQLRIAEVEAHPDFPAGPEG